MAVKIHEPNLWRENKVGQMEKLSNSELQKQFLKDNNLENLAEFLSEMIKGK